MDINIVVCDLVLFSADFDPGWSSKDSIDSSPFQAIDDVLRAPVSESLKMVRKWRVSCPVRFSTRHSIKRPVPRFNTSFNLRLMDGELWLRNFRAKQSVKWCHFVTSCRRALVKGFHLVRYSTGSFSKTNSGLFKVSIDIRQQMACVPQGLVCWREVWKQSK